MINALFEKNGTESDAGSHIQHIESGPILAVMAITGCNQNASGSDLAFTGMLILLSTADELKHDAGCKTYEMLCAMST